MPATARPNCHQVCRRTAESAVPMISGVQLRAGPTANSQAVAPAVDLAVKVGLAVLELAAPDLAVAAVAAVTAWVLLLA